ncbi:MAG TPA: AAA family ATPase [Thermoanaerobaculia bacterium]|nr:AAA family ATPase [Thermoanaerobaculia bacterium]
MYEKAISINIISPTLVMAMIDDASLILIFSFSPLNKNARLYLGQYAKATNKDVRVYDEETLEELILTTPDARKEFATIADDEIPVIDRFLASGRISKDPDIDYASTGVLLSGDDRDIHLSIRSTFAVDVLLTNAGIHSDAIRGRIRIEPETFESYRLLNHDLLVDPTIEFSVGAGASRFERLLFRARRDGKLKPPRIVVERADGTAEELRLDPIVVSSILAVPLVGEAAHNARRRFQETAGARNKPIFYYLHGGSGTGKSRLLLELRDELLARSFSVFSFNGADESLASFDVFIRHLVARLAKLPLLEGIEAPEEKVITEASERGVSILELLYAPEFSPAKNIAICLRSVQSLLASRKAAILIDNLQYFDDETIAFLNEIVSAGASSDAKTVWAFGINDDMTTPEMPASAFAGRLAAHSTEHPEDTIQIVVSGFSDDDRLHYLNEALTLSETLAPDAPSFVAAYPRTARMILDATESHKPLFLEQTLHYAADRGALRLLHGVMYVANIEELDVALASLPPNVRTILARRWERIRTRLSEGALRAIGALSILSVIPLMMGKALGFTNDDARSLESRGLVRITDTNDARFHHEQHERFFTELYGTLDEANARELHDRIEGSGFAPNYPLELATLRYAAHDMDDDDVAAMARLLVVTELSGQARQRSAPLFLEILNGPWHSIDPSLELEAVSSVCQSVKRHRAFATAAESYTRSYEIRKPRLTRYLPAGEAWFEFVRHQVNAYFAVHRDGDALPLLQESVRLLPRFTFSSPLSQRLAHAKLLNRLGVAYKTIHDLDGAVAAIRESLDIASAAGEWVLAYKNYVDWGYIHHGFAAHNDDLIARWSDALRLFDDAETAGRPMESERASAMLHRAAILILQRDPRAMKIIDDGILLSERRLTPFHEIKLLLLRVVAELVWGASRQRLPALLSYVDRAQDRAVTVAAYRSYWTVFYTRALLLLLLEREREALDTFVIALQQLAGVLNDPRMEERYAPFYEDLAISFRRFSRPLDSSVSTLIRNARIRSEALAIATMTDARFADFISTYRPTATYHDGRFNLPVP